MTFKFSHFNYLSELDAGDKASTYGFYLWFVPALEIDVFQVFTAV